MKNTPLPPIPTETAAHASSSTPRPSAGSSAQPGTRPSTSTSSSRQAAAAETYVTFRSIPHFPFRSNPGRDLRTAGVVEASCALVGFWARPQRGLLPRPRSSLRSHTHTQTQTRE
ncbi:hypothetical protein PYCCODRAFT_1011451 [Trametes coccinea BRFM310]|uniref:Uncharacterized protein n=1 Tax=Trametes coccinea (strain BRFM310) TaxID=1353009 RepID=A0A1Y2IC05_TRAC3|nr:hypothetical protein PYCCODRAFT_1011451 [Trametes coccinea BRFM310]